MPRPRHEIASDAARDAVLAANGGQVPADGLLQALYQPGNEVHHQRVVGELARIIEPYEPTLLWGIPPHRNHGGVGEQLARDVSTYMDIGQLVLTRALKSDEERLYQTDKAFVVVAPPEYAEDESALVGERLVGLEGTSRTLLPIKQALLLPGVRSATAALVVACHRGNDDPAGLTYGGTIPVHALMSESAAIPEVFDQDFMTVAVLSANDAA